MSVREWERAAKIYRNRNTPGFEPEWPKDEPEESLDDFVSSRAGKVAKRLLKASKTDITLGFRTGEARECVGLNGNGLFRIVGDETCSRATSAEVSSFLAAPGVDGIVHPYAIVPYIRRQLDRIAAAWPELYEDA